MNQENHPNRSELELFFHGKLPPDRQIEIENHIENCAACCETLRELPHDGLVDRIHAAISSVADDSMAAETLAPESSTDIDHAIPEALLNHPRYQIIGQIGRGGMGVVYQAVHKLMERPVALKVIHTRLLASDIAIERFRQEVKAAAKLSHRNIVTAYDAETADDLHFLVMEYIEGINLADLISRKKQLPVLHACNYVMQAAQGLQHAEKRHMVHRDIKPHNLMRTPQGTVKILDFGLARFATTNPDLSGDPALTADFTALGTPDYMSPEQARDSRRVDVRSDLYSLGCTLYFLLAGHAPFPTGTAFEKVSCHLQTKPDSLAKFRSDIPDEVLEIVDRLLAKSPDDRFQTPAELVEAIRPFGRPDSDSSTTNSDTKQSKSSLQELAETIETQLVTNAPKVSARRGQAGPNANQLATYAAIVGVVVLVMVLAFVQPWAATENENLIPPPRRNAIVRQSPEAHPAATQSEVNLLAGVDLNRDVVAGSWDMQRGSLVTNAAVGSRMVLPYDPPREYDLQVQFTRQTGEQSVAIHFISGEGRASLDLDGWAEHVAGIQNINGQDMRNNATRVDNIALVNGRRYTVLLQVRRNSVTALLNGQQLVSYRGDGSNLSLLNIWELPRPSLGLGAYESQVVFHEATLIPVAR